jgi:hypothetical protein
MKFLHGDRGLRGTRVTLSEFGRPRLVNGNKAVGVRKKQAETRPSSSATERRSSATERPLGSSASPSGARWAR